MPDIVDEFVVTLGLDPSSFKREMKDFRDDLRQTKEETRRTTRDMEADGRRAAESFNRLKNEIVGLFLVVAGGRGIGGLVQDLIHGAAETGRFGQAIGMATERVSVWEMAVQSMGGTAQDARAALAALNAEYTSYMLTGRAVHDADLAALGISANDLQSPEQLALALAERRNNMTQREFTARLQRLGVPDSFIRTLATGRRGVEALLEQMERVGPITDRDARAAIEMERQWAILTNRLRNELRPVLTWLVEQALPWIIEHGPEVARVMGIGIAGGIALMTVALVRAAGPIGIIIAGLTTIISLWSRMPNFSQFGAAIQYHFLGIRASALENRADALNERITRNPDGSIIDIPENRDLANQRLAVLTELTDLQQRRQHLAEDADTNPATNPPPGSGHSGHDWRGSARSIFGGSGHSGHDWRGSARSIFGGGSNDLARVRQTESGNNYNRVVYDTFRNMNLTAMTLGRLYNWQNGPLRARTRYRRGADDPGSTGVGAYQFESRTLRTMAEQEFGDGWQNQLFSPANQDRMARRLRSQYGLTPWAIGGTGGRLVRGGAGVAARARAGAGGGNVHVGSVVVYVPPGTPRQQAEKVADEIPRAVQRRGVVTQANGGLR